MSPYLRDIMNDFNNIVEILETRQDIIDLERFGLTKEEIIGYLIFDFFVPNFIRKSDGIFKKHQRRDNIQICN